MRVAFLICLCLSLVGCGKKDPLVGTWKGALTVLGHPGEQTISFAPDGTFTTTTKVDLAGGVSLTAKDKGTWKLQGDMLTQHLDDVNWQFTSPNASAAAAAQQRFDASKATLMANANAQGAEKIVWSGNDSFSRKTESGNDVTFTRQ